MKQYSKLAIVILLFTSCSQQEATLTDFESENIETSTTEISIEDETAILSETTTTIEIEQIDKFQDNLFVINKEKSTASYLAPKDFLNTNFEIVKGSTNQINGGFELSLNECEQADSCLYIKNLLISVDLSTLKSGSSIRDGAIKNNWLESKLFPSAIYKIDEIILPNNNFDSKIDETVVGILTIRNIEVSIPFSITAYMQDDQIYISGITEVDTTWFGFDAPTKFNAWEVLNPIGIEIDFVAEKSDS